MRRKLLACGLGLFFTLIIVLVVSGEKGGASDDDASTKAMIVELQARIAAVDAAIQTNIRREDAQARGGFGLSDDQYWSQFERNQQEYGELLRKRGILEMQLKALKAE